MQLRRLFGLTDLAILVVAAFAFALPPREMIATPGWKATDDQRFWVSLSEARSIVAPGDPVQAEEMAEQLGHVERTTRPRDWAVEVAHRGVERAGSSPNKWRALLATSVAYVDRLEPKEAYSYATSAREACMKSSGGTCPDFEVTRMDLYIAHLEGGLDSGIDPKQDPTGFRKAGESRLRIFNSK
jgi:hypothetical protein